VHPVAKIAKSPQRRHNAQGSGLALKLVSSDDFDKWVRPEDMTGPEGQKK